MVKPGGNGAKRLSNLGVLVFQFAKVSLKEVRGLALLRTPMPVAGINGKELPEAKAFTLFHEVVHLMLAAGNEEAAAATESRRGDDWMAVERFAEMAASHTIVPDDALRDLIGRMEMQRATWDIDNVRRVAKKFRLTPLAMATRLRESGYINWTQYNAWREQWQAYVATLPPRRGGFATPVEKAVNRAGQPFARLVLEALSANRITPVDASRYLDLKFEHFNKLRTHLMHEPGKSSSMSNPAPPTIYSVDSSSLMDWQARNYPTDVFTGLITNIDALIAAGRFIAPALVKEEIGAVGTTELIDWTENHSGFSFPMLRF